jgi:predicted amidohydrolase YtcJ
MGRWPDGWHPHEAIGVFEAIDGYTRGAAVAAGVRTGEGRIAPGCRADLVALSHDIVADPEALEACRVDLTVIGGTPMHDPLGLAV